MCFVHSGFIRCRRLLELFLHPPALRCRLLTDRFKSCFSFVPPSSFPRSSYLHLRAMEWIPDTPHTLIHTSHRLACLSILLTGAIP
jgi:hypothetical protein